MSITEYNSEKTSLIAQSIRTLSIDAVQKANSGHPGMPLGAADMAAVLYTHFIRFNPQDPEWIARDRFVLSAGHGSMLLYSLLHLFDFGLSMNDLKEFRQWDSITPGHPEFGLTAGVETTTGPLGQGFANGVGLALSSQLLREGYGTNLLDSIVYGIVSDGDLMEGVASEAASLAGCLKLGNLVYLYDDNEISIGGSTDICFTEDVPARFESYGWHVQSVDGHNTEEIYNAVSAAVAETGQPSIICCRTTIGYGSPNKAGSADSHGSPLGEDEVLLTKQQLGCEETEAFFVSKASYDACQQIAALRKEEYEKWMGEFESWGSSHADKKQALHAQMERAVPTELKADLLAAFAGVEKEATRASSGKAVQVIAKHLPYFTGGSADLEPSNKTLIQDSSDIASDSFAGRNIRFGVREHAMGSLVNGLAYTKAWIPYTGTFLVFSDYMRPTLRIAALSHLQSLFIFTHDSFWVGEDGPTHQPVEHVASLRIIPGLHVFRPADGVETAMSYMAALEHKNGPSALLFTRQGVPALQRSEGFDPDSILKGGYVVNGAECTDTVLIATGSEVWLAVDAAQQLASKGISCRVVSMPCVELFLEQDQSYIESVIPSGARVATIEAGVTNGWERFSGRSGLNIGIDRFGASAPGNVLAEKFGFTPDAVAAKVQDWLAK